MRRQGCLRKKYHCLQVNVIIKTNVIIKIIINILFKILMWMNSKLIITTTPNNSQIKTFFGIIFGIKI